jgi:SP family general alpha glucoside:H+ symporter-like MFS transporter
MEQVEFSMTGKLLDENAKAATVLEHSMTLWEGIKLHRKAVFRFIIVSSSIIMEGYDTTLIGSFYGYPMFQKKYGNTRPLQACSSLHHG